MVVIGDVIVAKIIEKLVEIGFDYAADQYFAPDTRMKQELERLKKALPRIKAVVEMAESGQQEISGGLNEWLWELKDAVYDADDVLDELDYLRLQKHVEAKTAGGKGHGHSGSKESKAHGFFSASKRKFIKFSKRVLKSDPTLEKLREAIKRLDEVATSVGSFCTALKGCKQLHQRHQTQGASSSRETGPILTERKVFGRHKEREELLRWLKDEDESSNNVSLFSIVGHGGVGKTTLAQLVYNDESLANSFNRKIWVCISTPFDVKKAMTGMIEYAAESRPEVGGLGALQEALKKLVSSGKFLLVLDDAWNDDNRSDWDKLFAPLRSGHKGSKILLTTRTERVAEMAALAFGGSTKEPTKLRPLDDDSFLSLFNQYAFAGVNSCDYRKLESIGEQIARRLGGLPLAAKTIGALLNSKLDDSHWTRILKSSNISDDVQQRDGVMSVLMLSYHHLPVHLRTCFAYFSIFPQDYMFIKDDLVFMWMALGFIQQSPQSPMETPEDIGRRYFDDLLKLSFLEQSYYTDYYNMHDLLHDLTRKVSHDECFRFVEDMRIDQIPNTVRHLYFRTDKLSLLKNVDKWKNLCTLVLIFRGYVNEHAKAFEEVFKSLKSIRVLCLTIDGMKVLPDAIGNLRHLRYLSIHHDIFRLPSSFCKLYHLQVLASEKFSTESVLGLNGLISLRHMIPSYVCYEKIEGIGTLTSLQKLSFPANAYRISKLKDLTELCELMISGLKNDKHCKEVSMIELYGKKNLVKLQLVWSDQSDVADEYEQVLDCLQSPDSLKELAIRGYQGARSPCWMEPGLLKNLEYINLRSSKAWKHLPFLGKLPYLKHLELTGLEIETLPRCPSLQILIIENCPKLKALPPLPLSLQKLVLEDVGLSNLPTFWVDPDSNCSGSSCNTSISSSSSLLMMQISRCEKLASVAGLLRHHLTSLRYLDIGNCKELVDLHAEEGFQHLRSIEHMWIENCLKLKMDPDTIATIDCFPLSSLQILSFSYCGELDSFFPTLLMQCALTCLLNIELHGCDNIRSFPSEEACGRLTSLRWLTLIKCGELTTIEGLKALPHLHVLTIYDCPKLVQAAAAATSASIKWKEEEFTLTVDKLDIDDPLLLHVEPLRRLTSLREVHITDCSHLEGAHTEPWLLQNTASLQCLYLNNIAKSLPCSLQNLSSLKCLELAEAYELQSLPQLPLSLQKLKIWSCNGTLKEQYRENEGADWPNIQHIRHITISL